MQKIKWFCLIAILLLMGACSETNEENSFTQTGFVFTINPQSETVTLAATRGGLGAQAVRTLVPDEDLSLVDDSFSFLPGNVLEISAAFKNITETLEFSQMSFAASGENYVASTEPTVSDADLGGDGVLSPGETSSQFGFRVEHRGEPFSYFVTVSADVTDTEPGENEAPTVSISNPEEGTEVNANVTVTGTASDDTGVVALSYSLNGGAAVEVTSSLSGEDFSFIIGLGDLIAGENSVVVTAEDGASLTGSDNVSFVVSEDEASTGTVVITVRDASSNEVISDATVSSDAFGGAPVEDPTGTYTLDGIPADTDLTLTITAPGYIPFSLENVNVPEGETVNLEALLTRESSRLGNISGTVTDAQTGDGVANVTVNLREGGGATSGPVVQSTTTSVSGAYAIDDLVAGNYTAEALSPGYITNYFDVVVVGGETRGDQNVTITRELEGGQWRIVLTWGETPRDLDSHITGPTATGNRFHVYYPSARRSYTDSATDVDLDVDDTTSFGPETVTIREQTSGIYRYSVHDFTNRRSSSSSAMAASGAKVEVFQGNNLVREFSVPNEAGTLWTVFELNGSNLVPINQLSYESNPGAIE